MERKLIFMSDECVEKTECVKMLFNEYKLLREEIITLSALHNKLVTFAITSVITIVGASVFVEGQRDSYLVMLVSYAILIPMIYRIAYSRRARMKISAYMI